MLTPGAALPGAVSRTPDQAGSVPMDTQAFQTPLTPLRVTSSPLSATPEPPSGSLDTDTPATSTISATLTPDPSNTPTVVCDRAAPGNPIDLSIPDDTHMQPGEAFTKTWRLINAGNCPWTRDYAVVFFSGKILGAPKNNYFPKRVEPGDSVDISLDMISPQKAGTYQSNWKLSNTQNQLFGIGPNGDAPFWVRIIVDEPNTATVEPTTPTPTPTSAIATAGVATLKAGDALDLAANQIVTTPADVVLTTNAAGDLFITPQGDAQVGIYGASEPALSDCQAAALKHDPIGLNSINNGTFFCYHTRQNQPGWLRLVSVDSQEHSISVEFLSWAIP